MYAIERKKKKTTGRIEFSCTSDPVFLAILLSDSQLLLCMFVSGIGIMDG